MGEEPEADRRTACHACAPGLAHYRFEGGGLIDLGARIAAAPAGLQEMTLSGGDVSLDRRATVMIGPPLHDSNGLPYEIGAFDVAGYSPGTAAFDHAEESGDPLAITPVTPPQRVTRALPLDQTPVEFRP
jgi:hypothetical protein